MAPAISEHVWYTCRECGWESTVDGFHASDIEQCNYLCKGCSSEQRHAKYQADPEKERTRTRQWREKNLEKARASSRLWRLGNPEKTKAYSKCYYEENLEEIKSKAHQQRVKNPEKARARSRQWREKNPEKAGAVSRRWYAENSEKKKAYSRQRYAENPDKAKANTNRWCKDNPDKVRANARMRAVRKRLTDPAFKIECSLRSRLRHALNGTSKSVHTKELLGCSIDYLLSHLECQFWGGMTWENYGRVWEVDHVVACARFDLADPAQQRECFNWTNLRPMFTKDNRSKGARY